CRETFVSSFLRILQLLCPSLSREFSRYKRRNISHLTAIGTSKSQAHTRRRKLNTRKNSRHTTVLSFSVKTNYNTHTYSEKLQRANRQDSQRRKDTKGLQGCLLCQFPA
ncbi:unnamed protein product, partial [Ectocarpus sp. 6 AP-2014]